MVEEKRHAVAVTMAELGRWEMRESLAAVVVGFAEE